MSNRPRRLGVLIPRTVAATALALIILLAGGPALATDGVIEINQAKVMAHGGFPFTIRFPGSYRLTSNLVVPNASTTAIKVSILCVFGQICTSNVTIDLNGFSITGPGNAGSGDGIDATNQDVITIHNGAVVGMGNKGIVTGHRSRMERMKVLRNGSGGIACGDDCEISHNISSYNVLNWGILCGHDCEISHNVSSYNGKGIGANAGSVVINNTANHNGVNGISVDADVTVRGNNVSSNGSFGLECFGFSGYADNAFASNKSGNISVACVNLGQNLCDTKVCP